jgi:hypothetical protein
MPVLGRDWREPALVMAADLKERNRGQRGREVL